MKKINELKGIYNELCNGEIIIKEMLHSKQLSLNDRYEKYGMLDKNWVQRYKIYITNFLNNNSKKEFNYDIRELKTKTEEKIFCLIKENNYHTYYFPLKYVLVTEKFISMISKYFNNNNDYFELMERIYYIIIGGKCIIIK